MILFAIPLENIYQTSSPLIPSIQTNAFLDQQPGVLSDSIRVVTRCGWVVAWRMGSQDGRKWLGSPPFISHVYRPFGRGTTNPTKGTKLTMVINHLRPSWDDPPSSFRACSIRIPICFSLVAWEFSRSSSRSTVWSEIRRTCCWCRYPMLLMYEDQPNQFHVFVCCPNQLLLMIPNSFFRTAYCTIINRLYQ